MTQVHVKSDEDQYVVRGDGIRAGEDGSLAVTRSDDGSVVMEFPAGAWTTARVVTTDGLGER